MFLVTISQCQKSCKKSRDIFTKSFIANITNITPSTLHSRVQFTTVQCRIAWRHYNNAPYYLQVAFCKSFGSSNNVFFYLDWQMRHKELQNHLYRCCVCFIFGIQHNFRCAVNSRVIEYVVYIQ